MVSTNLTNKNINNQTWVNKYSKILTAVALPVIVFNKRIDFDFIQKIVYYTKYCTRAFTTSPKFLLTVLNNNNPKYVIQRILRSLSFR